MNIDEAIGYLKDNGIDSFEQAGILVIPVSSVDELHDMVSTARSLFKECGYEKSWRIDPYYFENSERNHIHGVVNSMD